MIRAHFGLDRHPFALDTGRRSPLRDPCRHRQHSHATNVPTIQAPRCRSFESPLYAE